MTASVVSGAVECPITGNPSREYARKGRAVYFRDPISGVIFLAERPRVEAMAAFVDTEYETGVYREYADARELKLATMRRRMHLVRAYANGRRLLDVGCSTGFFLEAALESNFDPVGIELSSVAINLARPSVRDRIVHGDVNALLRMEHREFDVVTAFDIIEHTLDPLSFLDDVGRLLAPAGLLVMSTPDTGHWLRLLMRGRWPMLQPDQHTFLFSRTAMRSVLVDHGYQPLAIRPARKVLTADYLVGQLRQTNPTAAHRLGRVLGSLPRTVRHRMVALNIGEMLVCARARSVV
jgi:2-polyprenyl-3-methyl-5-hydroxy-6-metoxy-1,4-benzoquinol methylase